MKSTADPPQSWRETQAFFSVRRSMAGLVRAFVLACFWSVDRKGRSSWMHGLPRTRVFLVGRLPCFARP